MIDESWIQLETLKRGAQKGESGCEAIRTKQEDSGRDVSAQRREATMEGKISPARLRTTTTHD
jgi:hypothetical protein